MENQDLYYRQSALWLLIPKCLHFVSSPKPGLVGFGNSPYAVGVLMFVYPSYLTLLLQTCDTIVNQTTVSFTAKSTCVLQETFDRDYIHATSLIPSLKAKSCKLLGISPQNTE